MSQKDLKIYLRVKTGLIWVVPMKYNQWCCLTGLWEMDICISQHLSVQAALIKDQLIVCVWWDRFTFMIGNLP